MEAFTAKTKAEHPNSHVCDLDKPYSDGYTCFACEAPTYFFDYNSRKCVGCPEGTSYRNGACPKNVPVSNLDAMTDYIGSAEDVQSVKDQIKATET